MKKLRLKSKVRFTTFIVVTMLLLSSVLIEATAKPDEVKTVHVETQKNIVKTIKVKQQEKKKTTINRGEIERNKPYTEDEILLATLIYGEAGVEEIEGKLAVGTVVANRMINKNKKLFGGPTLKGVVFHKLSSLSKYQFDCVTSNWHKPDKDSLRAARMVLNGYRSFGPDVLYYYNPSISTDSSFIKSMSTVVDIGRHRFCKAKW